MKKESIVFGIYPVLEALKSDTTIGKVYIQKGLKSGKLDEIRSSIDFETTSVNEVPVEKLDRLTKGNHQGVAAIISPITFSTIEEVVEKSLSSTKAPLFLLLDQISDVRNFGAIIRTAECTGVDAIIIQKKGGAPVTGDTVKASAGAIFNVPICKVDHIKDAIFYLQGSGISTIAATEKTATSIYEQKLDAPIAILMGSEGKGIAKSVLSLVDHQASLPLLGEIKSLNVSVACGAFLYEVVRQRA
ncbi:23S rRNA (guanosine(2251)-2'-O)-methyltransferase RlmB [Flavobacteriaceae bacterium TK19130]|nr:23S rRNA (guanosine(2251)-2'-O)-methyltransferase RlmB [Thermobacterium salinum]